MVARQILGNFSTPLSSRSFPSCSVEMTHDSGELNLAKTAGKIFAHLRQAGDGLYALEAQAQTKHDQTRNARGIEGQGNISWNSEVSGLKTFQVVRAIE